MTLGQVIKYIADNFVFDVKKRRKEKRNCYVILKNGKQKKVFSSDNFLKRTYSSAKPNISVFPNNFRFFRCSSRSTY